jgi:hypothetical protein
MLNQFSEGAAKTFFSSKKMDSCDAADVALCAGFRSPALWSYPLADAGGDRKAPRHEIAVGDAATVPRALWGFGRGGWLDEF